MAVYEIEISRTAEKQLKKLSPELQRRIAGSILSLADEPKPRGARKLTGYQDVYRIRVGQVRVLYSIASARLVVIVLKIGHRRDVYRSVT